VFEVCEAAAKLKPSVAAPKARIEICAWIEAVTSARIVLYSSSSTLSSF